MSNYKENNTEMGRDHDIDQLLQIAHLIGSIFFYGDFKAETLNERKLEILLKLNGFMFSSEEDVLASSNKFDIPIKLKAFKCSHEDYRDELIYAESEVVAKKAYINEYGSHAHSIERCKEVESMWSPDEVETGKAYFCKSKHALNEAFNKSSTGSVTNISAFKGES